MNYLRSALEYIQTGGVVMWPLLLVSLLLWGSIIYRLLILKQLYRNNITSTEACLCVQQGVTEISAAYQGIAALLLRGFLSVRSGNPHLDRHLLDEAAMQVRATLRQGLELIGVLAAVAPLLGLLGTVLGMIGTFDCIAVFGTGNARALAGGISEALVTTQTGLIIAIPGLFMRNFIQRRAEGLERRLNTLTQQLKRQLDTYAALPHSGVDL
ncbi:MAG: MotA/TolQ/ExbB proton channel family protein [Desulfuromonas sp.]|nr:MotA/TolQ/ExbB proton channel family protein [Desulfuromonas sp.]